MKYKGKPCTESREFTDDRGAGIEWRFPGRSGVWEPTELGCFKQRHTRVETSEETARRVAAAEVAAERLARRTTLEGILVTCLAGTAGLPELRTAVARLICERYGLRNDGSAAAAMRLPVRT